MKKRLIWLFLLILIIAVMGGCKLTLPESKTVPPEQSDTPSPDSGNSGADSSAPDIDAVLEGLGGLPGGFNFSMMTDGWPDDMAPELPQYTYGKQTSYGQYPDGEIIIMAGETGPDDLDAYLQALESSGWTVQKDSGPSFGDETKALKGAYTVDFTFQGDNTTLLIEVIIAKAGEWPSFSEYPINVPAPEGYEIVDVDVNYFPDDIEPGSGHVGGLYFTCLDMDWDAVLEYCQMLEDGGYFEPFLWQGKEYYCTTVPDQFQPDGAGNMYCYFDISLVDY